MRDTGEEELTNFVGVSPKLKTEYWNAISAHEAVGRWLDNLEKLNESQRKAIDSLLAIIKPGISLNSIDQAIKNAEESVKKRIEEYQ